MTYVDGMVAAVPTANREAYIAHARQAAALFREAGAISCAETWGVEVPRGEVTDFHRAVQARPDETIVFSWIAWPSKAARDAAWEKLMADERMSMAEMPFDGRRMIYGGFESLLEG